MEENGRRCVILGALTRIVDLTSFHVAWVKESELQGPPKTSVNRLLQVVVTSLHWLPADSQDHALLVVTYLNHGVQ